MKKPTRKPRKPAKKHATMKPDKGWALVDAAVRQMQDESHKAFIRLPKRRQQHEPIFHFGYVRGYVSAACKNLHRPHPDAAKLEEVRKYATNLAREPAFGPVGKAKELVALSILRIIGKGAKR